MNLINEYTHEFVRKSISHDGSSLYTSICYVLDLLGRIDHQSLYSSEVDRIPIRKSIENIIKKNRTEIKQSDTVDIESKLQDLASLIKTKINLLSIRQTDEGLFIINTSSYNDDDDVNDNNQSDNECVYILYDELTKHFDPLVIRSKQNSNEEITRFNCTNDIVNRLFLQFIQDNFPIIDSRTNDLLNDVNDIITDYNVTNTVQCKLNKRKSTDDDDDDDDEDDLFNPGTQKRLSPTGSSKYMYFDELQITDDSLASSFEMSAATIEQQSTDFRLEVQPRITFRGRTNGELKPITSVSSDGEPIESRPPSYVLDRKNQRLSLLISEISLFPTFVKYGLQICIVTRDINGYTYIHPYFKFQGDRYLNTIPNENPIFLPINAEELEEYSPGIRKLQLKLAVIKLKRSELKNCKQPLDIFSTSGNPTEPPITTIYNSVDILKDIFHLNDIRFAITLWMKWDDDKEFYPTSIRCISAVSTEVGKGQHRTTRS